MLHAALDLGSDGFRSHVECAADDIRGYLDMGEWELALGMLVDVGDEHPQSVRYWQLLAEAADLMRLDRRVAWCHWRAYESVNGVIRVDLALTAPEDGGRQSAIPGAGVLRPLWDIGLRTSAGEPDLAVARIWVESAPTLEPGQPGSVRMAPLTGVAMVAPRAGGCDHHARATARGGCGRNRRSPASCRRFVRCRSGGQAILKMSAAWWRFEYELRGRVRGVARQTIDAAH